MEILQILNDNLGPIAALGGSVTAIVGVLYKWVIIPLKTILAHMKQQDENITDLLRRQLVREHDFYITRGWCSASDKHDLDGIYTRYKNGGHNHLAEQYMRDLIALPEHPPEKEE